MNNIPLWHQEVTRTKADKAVVKLYKDKKFLDSINIPSVMWPLNGAYELFHYNNCELITDENVCEIVDALPYQIGHCYTNTENVVNALSAAGYSVKSYCGWLFIGPGTHPIHHCWAVLDGKHVIDLADDNTLLMANQEQFERAVSEEERAALHVEFTKWSLAYKHSERCMPFGMPSPRFLYIGCECDRVTGINIYNRLCREYPNHPCNEKVRYANGMTGLQARLAQEGVGL